MCVLTALTIHKVKGLRPIICGLDSDGVQAARSKSRRQNCRPSDMAIHVMVGVFTNWQVTRPIRFKYFNNVPPYTVIFTLISKNLSTTYTCATQHFHSTHLIGSPKIIHTLNESAEAYHLVAWQQGRESHERRERAFTRS